MRRRTAAYGNGKMRHVVVACAYNFPSTSVMVAPLALAINRGVPPTPRNARTGEFTPPGINSVARAKSLLE